MSYKVDWSILVDNLSKVFRVYRRPSDRWRELLTKRSYHDDFYALRDISFQACRGETLGIIGQNGSGKSTLLKILARLMLPTTGRIETHGRVSSLIELGTGFHREFSGRSNVFLNASLLGLSEAEISERFPTIVEFSGLGEFIDRPLKTYSTGMWVRLAFSVAISINPQILLIDEALAVGDILFQQKCLNRLKEFQAAGATIVFVSHDLGAVKLLCQRAILLEHGQLAYQGRPDDVAEFYLERLSRESSSANQAPIRLSKEGSEDVEKRFRRYGNRKAVIEEMRLQDGGGKEVSKVLTGRPCRFQVQLEINEPLEELTVGILLRDKYGNDIFGTNTYNHQADLGKLERGRRISVTFELGMSLAPGDYFLTAALHGGRTHFEDCYDWIENLLHFEVLPHGSEFVGIANLPVTILVRDADNEDSASVGENPDGGVVTPTRVAPLERRK